MKKKTKIIYISIISLIVISGLILYFKPFQQTVFYLDKGIFDLTTDFTGLIGNRISVTDIGKSCNYDNRLTQNICLGNVLIYGTYGYVIFDGPAKLSLRTKSNIIENMKEMNAEVNKPREYSKFNKEQKKLWDNTFKNGMFSEKLIREINTNSYNYNKLKNIAYELDNSLNTYCNAVNNIFLSGKFKDFYSNNVQNTNIDLIIQFCNNKPKNIFTITNNKIELNTLPDITLYNYERFDIICEKNPSLPVTTCRLVEKTEVQKTLAGTLSLSKISFNIKPLGNDFVISYNKEPSLYSVKDFKKYILQMPLNDALDITKITSEKDLMTYVGFIIFTSNKEVNKLIKDFVDYTSQSSNPPF